MKYRIDGGELTVQARSKIHDVRTVWDKVSGHVDADLDALEQARAMVTVDMTAADAGDWLKTRKLKSDYELEAHPRATFELRAIKDVVLDGPRFTSTAEGVLRWRGKEVVLSVAGRGMVDAARIEAAATFDLDIRTLGLVAPRVLMIKIDDVVTVEVSLRGAVIA